MAVAFDWLNDTNLVISSSTETIYANAASTTTFIDSITLHNTHSSAVTVTLYFVPDSSGSVGTAATGNQVFKQALDANQTYTLNDIGQIFSDVNDTLQAVADVDAKATIYVNGLKIT